MRFHGSWLAASATLAGVVLLAGCSSAGAPSWSFAAASVAPAALAVAAPATTPASPSPAAAAPAPSPAMAGMPSGPTPSAAPAAPDATEAPDPNAPSYSVVNPAAPAVLAGTVHDVDFPIIEKDVTVAKGYVVHAWTFGGTVPGPTLRVHLGDTVRVHLTNQTAMSHSIDFHASQTAMDDQMVEIKPGATWTYTFHADYAGVWMYHCGTAPALCTSPTACSAWSSSSRRAACRRSTHEFAFVQSEWYLGAPGPAGDYAKANAAAPAPDFVVFNGVANQYKDNPIQVNGRRPVRIFVLIVGPNVDSSFHIVGTIFDTVIKEGIVARQGQSGRMGQPGGRPVAGPGRHHRAHDRREGHVCLRDPRLQLRGQGRHRRPDGEMRRAVLAISHGSAG